ncbi:response regulator transcription factor [Anaeromicropila populeti]|uniref:Stage 0 sporulation protein A homolog n=1 Tax=Anaeromicropila populeti TaxID=37658 RepID=A0A1I6IXP8_9FIRM|nr:response regulator transcription factor [Anaeromicropila populeti]SFR71411.1 two component transcriptional regulator, LuxR family [Anaeromicropila populeti]
MITVLIADDQTLFRTMLEMYLATDKEIDVVASVENGESAVKMALEHRPDVALLDSQMPVMDGITALAEIKDKLPATKVAILTAFEDAASIANASGSKADGYLIKDMTPEVLIMAVKCIYNDIILIHKNAYELMTSFTSPMPGHDRAITCGGFTFDKVDVMLMKHIADGRTNKEIAKIMDYSEGTIKNRISNIISMTGLSDRTQISVFAIKNNIV